MADSSKLFEVLIFFYYAPSPAEGRATPKAVKGRSRAGCSYFMCTFIGTCKVSFFFKFKKFDQVTTCYCCNWLLYILGWLLQDIAVKGYHVFYTQVVFQKRKPQIDGSFLSLMHIYGQEKSFNGKLGYYRILLWVVTMYSRLLCILNTSGMPKTEATNWRLVSKSTAHIRSGKSLSMDDPVTTCCCCELLLCLLVLAWLLQATAVKSYHVFLLHVV